MSFWFVFKEGFEISYRGSEFWGAFGIVCLFNNDFPFVPILLCFSIALLEPVLSGNGKLHIFFSPFIVSGGYLVCVTV